MAPPVRARLLVKVTPVSVKVPLLLSKQETMSAPPKPSLTFPSAKVRLRNVTPSLTVPHLPDHWVAHNRAVGRLGGQGSGCAE